MLESVEGVATVACTLTIIILRIKSAETFHLIQGFLSRKNKTEALSREFENQGRWQQPASLMCVLKSTHSSVLINSWEFPLVIH